MKEGQLQTSLRKRIIRARRSLRETIAQGGPGPKIQEAHRSLEALEYIEGQRRGRQSVTVLITAGVVTLYLAGVLSLIDVPSTSFSIRTMSRSITVTTAEATQNVLARPAVLQDITGSSASGKIEPRETDLQTTLVDIELHRRTTAILSRDQGCFRLSVAKGGMKLLLIISPIEADVGGLTWYQLNDGDSARMCSKDDIDIHIRSPAKFVLADHRPMGLDAEIWVPSLTSGDLLMAGAGSRLQLTPLHVLSIAGDADYRVVLTRNHDVSVSGLGHARTLKLTPAEDGADSLMPSQLTTLMNSSRLKGIVALVAAVIGTLLTIRQRWLGLF